MSESAFRKMEKETEKSTHRTGRHEDCHKKQATYIHQTAEVYSEAEGLCMSKFPDAEKCMSLDNMYVDPRTCMNIFKQIQKCLITERNKLLDEKSIFRGKLIPTD